MTRLTVPVPDSNLTFAGLERCHDLDALDAAKVPTSRLVIAALGDKVARRVLDSGEREELTPMTPFERKIVHDAVAAVPGVHSESEGVEPSRRVVVLLG